MKKIFIIFGLLIVSLSINAQTLKQSLTNATKVVIGEFNSETGNKPAIKWTESQLKRIAQSLYLDGTRITSASIKYDNKIDFWYIAAHGLKGSLNVSIAISLEKEDNILALVAGGCTQQCDPTGNCDCQLVVDSPCKSIRCDCPDPREGTGGCTAKISDNSIAVITKLAATFEDPLNTK